MTQATPTARGTNVPSDLHHADLLLIAADILRNPAGAVLTLRDLPRTDLDALGDGAGLDADTRDALTGVVTAAGRVEPDSLASAHTALFDAGGDCPPNETAYVRRDKGAVLGDICGFYRAFGFEPAGDSGEKADHVAAELEFAMLLLVMRDRARAADRPEQAEVTGDALSAFAADHLGEWLPAFSRRLVETAPGPLHEACGRFLAALWDHLCAVYGFSTALPGDDSRTAPRSEPENPCKCPFAGD